VSCLQITYHVQALILVVGWSVMSLHVPRLTSCHILCPLVVHLFHWNLFFLDVWGPAIDSFGCKKYYVSFIDDYSKFTWIYLLRSKSEVFKYFIEFQRLVERWFDCMIITVQFDWGGEYEKFNSFFL
jgi:hypothetical protein